MSPENKEYGPVKKEAPSKKVDYAKPPNWGVNTNKRLSATQVWRK